MRHRYWYQILIFAFILGSHKGFVALWTSPAVEPDYIFPYSVAALPRSDQERLEAGIKIRSKEELMELLEDYLS